MNKRNAKIVATIGPASNTKEILSKMVDAGMNVARLNFSHGKHEDHAARIALLRELSQEKRTPIAILQDLQGPKMRVGDLPAEGIDLVEDEIVQFSSTQNMGGNELLRIPLDVPNLFESLAPGNRILMDDGNLEVQVQEISADAISAKVIHGGKLTSHKGVNLPGANITIPSFTEKDRQDLYFGLDQNVDMVAISFVRTAQDILTVRQAMQGYALHRAKTPIIAKLERPEALENLDSLLQAADGVMVARGDLGVETSPASVPIMQKRIIKAANEYGKIVITATQMLESMIQNPRPTRAEASDVANAIFDGTDAVMLSGETASGQYPVESVKMMGDIALEAESHFSEWGTCQMCLDHVDGEDAVTMTRAAREIAHDRNVSAIAVFTRTGRTALLMAKARPMVPILAFTPEKDVYRKMSVFWGTTPFEVPHASNVEDMLAIVDAAILSSTSLEPGQQVVIISGLPVGAMTQPNFALLHTIGEGF